MISLDFVVSEGQGLIGVEITAGSGYGLCQLNILRGTFGISP